jgi:hypothetical protein
MDDLLQPITLPIADPVQIDPSISQTARSGFALGSDVANLYEYINRPRFEPDLTFDFAKEFKARQLPLSMMVRLANSKSAAELDFRIAKAAKEERDKQVLAASGWTGTVAAIGAGILSPTAFLPLVGPARGAKGVAQMFALAGAAAGAQNAALFLNQETMTQAELYNGVAMDTLLIGMMGGAYLGLTRPARVKLQKDIVRNTAKVDVAQSPADVLRLPPKPLQIEDMTKAQVKEEVIAEGIRDPGTIQQMLDEAVDAEVYVPLRDRALAIEKPKRRKANNGIEQSGFGGSWLEAKVAEGVTARFVKATGGTKFFVGGEYSISLHLDDGTEIRINQPADPNMESGVLAGRTPYYKQAELIEALANGELDDQLYRMLEAADEGSMGASKMEGTIPTSKLDADTPDAPAATRAAADDASLSAAGRKTRNTLGAQKAPNKVRQAAMNTLGRMSPAYRMLTQPLFASLRHAAAMMDMAGIRQAGLDTVEASAKDGTIIERIRGYDPYKVEFFKALDRHYYSYVYDGEEGFDMNIEAFTQIRSQFGTLPPGKISWPEYKQQVFEQLNTGQVEPNFAPAVAEFKAFFAKYNARHKQYMKEMEASGEEFDPLYKELLEDDLGDGITEYAHHIPDANKIIDNLADFINDFGNYNEKAMLEAYEKRAKLFTKRKQKLQFEREVAGLDEAEIVARMEEVESDIVFLDELPEMVDYRNERLSLTRQAKDEGWSKEELKVQIKDFNDNLSETVKGFLEERKKLLTLGRLYKKYGAKTTEKVTNLQAAAAKLTDDIADMFRVPPARLTATDVALAKTQKAKEALLDKSTKDLKKAVAALEKRRLALEKLAMSKRKNPASRAVAEDYFTKAKVRHDAMLERLTLAQGRAVGLDAWLSEINLVREDVVADLTRIVRSKASRAQDMEEAAAREAKEKAPLTPEERGKAQAQIGEELDQLELEFFNRYGVNDPEVDPVPDFKAQSRDLATVLAQKLTNTEVELSPAYHALRQEQRSAELLRVWKVPFAIKKKWLINDVELVASAYDRVMAPDLELWRAFGSPSGKNVIGDMNDELTILMNKLATAQFVKLPKGWADASAKYIDNVAKRIMDFGAGEDLFLTENNFSDTLGKGYQPLNQELRQQIGRYLIAETKAQTYNFDVAVQRLRAQRGVPRDSSSMWWRGGRLIKNLNVLTMMGVSTISSISDAARPIWKHGPMKVFKHGWRPFISNVTANDKTFRLKSKEINRKIGLNLEPVLHSRAQGLFDLAEDAIGRTKLERGVTVLTQKMGLIALYDYWTAGMKTISGNVTHATFAEYIPAVAKAWRENAEFTGDLLTMRTALREAGLSDLMVHRIAQQMEAPDGMEFFSNGGVLPNVHLWDDPQAFQAYQAAVASEVNKLIVTPGLERPNFVDENLAFSLLTQFKSFLFASNSRMVMSALQGNDPYLIQGVAFSLAFGALSYYIYAWAAGGRTLEDMQKMSPEDWMWEATKRSGILGALSIGTDAAERTPIITGDDTPMMFRKPTGLLGVFLGPTYTQMDRMARVITTLDDEEQAQNMRRLRQIFVPYQNHFLFRQLFDQVGEAMFGGEK